MNLADDVTNLTQQTTNLLNVFLTQRDNVGEQIKVAVSDSENAAQEPLVSMAVNLIDTQVLLVQLLSRQNT